MGKWLIEALNEKECHEPDDYAVRNFNDHTISHELIRNQSYINQNEKKAIKKIKICETKNLTTKKIQSRHIHVQFGDVLTQEELNNILGNRKLDQLTEAKYKEGAYFEVKQHKDLELLFSTLHEISPFSSEMKKAIVDFFVPAVEEKNKKILRLDLFSKFTKVTSLFNLSLDKVNENYSNYDKLKKEGVGFNLKPSFLALK